MDSDTPFKSSDVLVLRDPRGGAGLVLEHRQTGTRRHLDAQEAAIWCLWGEVDLVHVAQSEQAGRAVLSPRGLVVSELAARLVDDGFATIGHTRACAPNPTDAAVPVIAGGHVRWHAESPDLLILYNTAPMRQNNPLLALSPYGSLCWRGVLSGWSVGKLRQEVMRVFGVDEVFPFLKRLECLGFVNGLAPLPSFHKDAGRAVKEFPAPEVQWRLPHSAVPWYCLWELCTMCNLRCQICYQEDFGESGLRPEAMMRLARKIVEAGVFYVTLLGGEPLLRRDLDNIVRYLRDAHVFVKLITNGQRLSPDRVSGLAGAGLNQLEVSLDGTSAQSHEASRGKGTYRRALAAINNAQLAGIPRVGAVLTIHSENFHEITDLPKFLHALGVEECYISLFKKTGRQGGSVGYEPLSPEQRRELVERVDSWRIQHPRLIVTVPSDCSCGRTSLVIGPTGNARVCTFSYQSISHVGGASLAQVWQSLAAETATDGALGYCRRTQLLATTPNSENRC